MTKNLSAKRNFPDRAAFAADQWRKERPDLDMLPMTLIGRLKEVTQRILRDHLGPLFAERGLNQGDFDVLATLRRAGAPYGLTPTALNNATMVTSGAMTGRVDRLERVDLVRRQQSPDDRRETLVMLTRAGLGLIDEMITRHVENEARILSGLSRGEQETLSALLAKLISTMPEHYSGSVPENGE